MKVEMDITLRSVLEAALQIIEVEQQEIKFTASYIDDLEKLKDRIENVLSYQP